MKKFLVLMLSSLTFLTLVSVISPSIKTNSSSNNTLTTTVYAASRHHASRYHEGKDGARNINWHTTRFYIKRSTLRHMGAGATIAGVWIRKWWVAGFVSTFGYTLSNAPGGVYVDYDRLLSGFGGGITKVGWQ